MIGATTPLVDYRDCAVAVVTSVTWAGRTWRLSTRELTGTDMHADPGLLEAPDVTAEISLSPGGDIGTSVGIAVVLPAIAIADYIAAGYDLLDLEAEIAWVWHRDGVLLHAWSAREVRAKGYATEPEWGSPEQPAGYIACTIEDSPYRTQRPLSRHTWRVNSTTWPAATKQARYPLVLGTPDPSASGGGPAAPVIEVSAVPANVKVIVSIGWCESATLTLIDSSGSSATRTIEYQLDALGQLCAVVTLGGGLSTATGTTYESAWTAGPALAPMGGTGPLHIAAHLLALGGADLDIAEWARTAGLLNLPMGGYVDDPDSEAWEAARDLLAGLPVTMRRARDGWAPVLLDPHLAPDLAVATWREGGPWRRASTWSSTGASRIGRAEVSSEVSEIIAGATSARDAPLPHAWIRHLPELGEASQSLLWSWSVTTDRRVLAWLARSQAIGWEAAAFQAPAQWGREREGDWIYLAEDDRYAIVLRRTLADGVWDYTLARFAGR